MICDRRVPARVEGKVYKVAVRPAIMYGLVIEAKVEVTEEDTEVMNNWIWKIRCGDP